MEPVLTARCRRAYANAHTYHVNSIALSSDRETFISADDLRINLWHLDVSDRAFNVVDIKPPNMEDLTEARPRVWHCPLHRVALPRIQRGGGPDRGAPPGILGLLGFMEWIRA